MSQHNQTEESKLRLDFVREQLFGEKPFAKLTPQELKKLKFVTGAVGGARESGKLSKSIRAFIKEMGSDQDSVLGHAVSEITKGIGHMAKLYEALETAVYDSEIVHHLIDRTSEGEFRIVLGGAIRGIQEPNDSLQMRKMMSPHYTIDEGVDTVFLAADIPPPATKDDTQRELFDRLAADLLHLYFNNRLSIKPVKPIEFGGPGHGVLPEPQH